MPSGTVTILSLLSGLGYAISSSGLVSSDVPDSELQASVSHTLDVENWWLDSRHCCVHLQAVEGRGLSGVIKTRHHDLQLLPACRTRQLRLSEAPQLCLRSHGSGVLCSMIPSVPKSRLALSSLTGQTTSCWALFTSWEGHQRTSQTRHSHLSASLLGKFAGQCLWCCSQGQEL